MVKMMFPALHFVFVFCIRHFNYIIPFSSGQWFATSTPVSSTNKTDCHDITEILLNVALNNITTETTIKNTTTPNIIWNK